MGGDSCRLITDPELLKQWNHKEPLLEISNQYCSVVLPISKISVGSLKHAFEELNKARVDWILDLLFRVMKLSRRT